MKRKVLLLACFVAFAGHAEQSVSPIKPSTDPASAQAKLVVTASEIAERIGNIDAAAKSGNTYRGNPLLLQEPYRLNIESHFKARPGYGLNEYDGELFVVLEGSGTMTLGGALNNPRRDGTHLQSESVTGATNYKIAKGDVVMIPAGMVHAVTETDGKLKMLSLHLPVPEPHH